MKAYKLWCDGEIIDVILTSPLEHGDVIEEGDHAYTVVGRRFVGGNAYWAVSKQPLKSVYETRGFASV